MNCKHKDHLYQNNAYFFLTYRLLLKKSLTMMKKIIFLTILFWMLYPVHAQRVSDSLLQRSYDELLSGFNNSITFKDAERYGKTYIKKAKRNDNALKVAAGYHLLAGLYDDIKVLMYCDSIIHLTKNTPNEIYPASAYITKGAFYYEKMAYKRALIAFLEANEFARKYNNEDIIYKSNYTIGILKDQIGERDSALVMHRKSFAYAKQHNNVLDKSDYLNSIFALASTFNDLKMLDSATFYNRYGIWEAIRLKSQQKYHHFVLNSGITHYYEEDFQSAVDSIRKGLLYFKEKGNQLNVASGYYYLGRSYFKLKKNEEAIFYLKKVDTIFQKSKNVLPETRKSYTFLIDYYESEDSLKQQVHYLKQRTRFDSILYDHQLYLNKKIIDKYEMPKKLAEADAKAKKKQYKARIVIVIISVLLIITLLLLGYQYRKRIVYKKQAETLANEKEDIKLEIVPGNTKKGEKDIGVLKEVVDRILTDLTLFESNKGYLNPEVTLHHLAKKLQTNNNHLSRVVNHCKGLSFPNYLNKLRINYAVEALKTNVIYRKYTTKALANEFGFKRTETFNRAFIKYAGTRLSDYIKELENKRR